jgi:folate-binding protein YgfZ
VVPAEHAAWLWTLLTDGGRSHGVIPIGWETLNVLRIEAGIPWYGLDMDETNLLPETGLEEVAVSDTKGCYVGQEVIARLRTYGSVSRKLMGLTLEGPSVPQAQDPIMKDGQPLGNITSACCSPTLKRPIAMGYVKRPFYQVGATVQIAHESHMISATLVKPPFIQPGHASGFRPQAAGS